MVGASVEREGVAVGKGVAVASGVAVKGEVGVNVDVKVEGGAKVAEGGKGVSGASRQGPLTASEQIGRSVAKTSVEVGLRARSDMTDDATVDVAGAEAVMTMTCSSGVTV
jgi:UDP-3-O-[3-hydroxymyristoyl] glucosamine N-acyltransferase